jgi:Zn-dependent protease
VSEPSPQRGWLVGRAAGTPVVLSPGWLVAAVVLTALLLPFARQLAPGSPALVVWLVAGAAVMLLFASTFLHELAHAAVARRHGMPVHRIALTLLGGHTELGDRAPTAGVSAMVAAAGPVTNLALGVAAWLVWRALPGTGPWVALVLALAVTNGFVAVLNLLPGLPLDGGRVLEAGVWRLTGRRSTGTRVAGWVGRVVAAGIAVWAISPVLSGRLDYTQLVWGAVIAMFVWSGAGQAIASAGLEDALDRLTVVGLARPAVALPADLAVAGLDGAVPAGYAVVVVDPYGRPVGHVDAAALAAVPATARATTPLAAVAGAMPPEAQVQVGLVGRTAVEAVQRASARSPWMAVLGPDGAVVGLLHATDVVRALRTPA